MNDKFLTENRPNMNQNFSDRLYQRLSVRYPEKEDTLNNKKHFRIFKWQYASAVFLITAVLLVIFSAPVRAKASELIQLVAGFIMQEQEDSPLKNLDMSTGTEYPVQTKELADLMKDPPFPFSVPTWVPEGYTLGKLVGYSASWVMMGWSNSDHTGFGLTIQKEYGDLKLSIGENSAEEITINGQPAYIVRGFWNADGKWDPTLGIEICWNLDGRFYRLSYGQTEPKNHTIAPITGDMDAILAELIRMAESIESLQ